MKLPHMQFYTGDWLKDPRLSLCNPASRGVWMDLLCVMHELDRCGELRGTTDEIARLARCSTDQLEAALTDLQNKLAAEVYQRNGSWVIANRRMKREASTREKRALAGSKGGSQAHANREQNPDIDNDNGLERVREFARGEGIAESDADWFYWKGRGNGWTNGGKPILDWKATLRSWQRAKYLPSQRKQRIEQTEFLRPKERAPTYPKMPPRRDPTPQEVERAKQIAKDEIAKLQQKFKMP